MSWTLLYAAGSRAWPGRVDSLGSESLYPGVSWEGNHLGGNQHVLDVLVSKPIFLIQWGKYTPLFWNESQTQSLITGHVLPPPPPTAAIPYLTKIGTQISKGSSLYFPLWPPPAAARLCKVLGLGCTTLERDGDLPSDLVVRSLKNSRVGAALWKSCSHLLCYWPLENTGHRIRFLPRDGLQQPGREGMAFSLKEMQLVKRSWG